MRGFPKELLNASANERILYFENLRINHTNLQIAYNQVVEIVDNTEKGRVIIVYGPSGVGKSTLLQRVKNKIIEDNLDLIKLNPGIIPVVDFEISFSASGKNFNWYEFYRRFLKALAEPLIEEKISLGELFRKEKKKKFPDYSTAAGKELREALENALIYREVKFVLLDEAQHFLKIPQSSSLYHHMDTLKSFANITGTTFILFGTYELTKFLDINGQTTRRSKDVYFKRYDIRNNKDADRFKKAIITFQNNLPFEKTFDLIKHWEFLYERSIGCIGVLSDWLLFCVKVAIKKDLDTLSLDLITRCAPSTKKAYVMAEEAITKELEINDAQKSRNELQELLGITNYLSSEEILLKKDQVKNGSNTNRQKKVGQRLPKRDEIGVSQNFTK